MHRRCTSPPTLLSCTYSLYACSVFILWLHVLYASLHASDKFGVLNRFVDSAQWWVNGDNWESSVLFFVMFFQYITCALAYSFGSTFRLSLLYNWAVVVCPHTISCTTGVSCGLSAASALLHSYLCTTRLCADPYMCWHRLFVPAMTLHTYECCNHMSASCCH